MNTETTTFNFDAMPSALKQRMLQQTQKSKELSKEQIEAKLRKAEEKRMDNLRVKKTIGEKVNEALDRKVQSEITKVELAVDRYNAKFYGRVGKQTLIQERIEKAQAKNLMIK